MGSDHLEIVSDNFRRPRDDEAGKPSVATVADVAFSESGLQQSIIYFASCPQQPVNDEANDVDDWFVGDDADFAGVISSG